MSTAPESRLLEEVLGWIDSGELRVPRAARPFVWSAEQRCALFDSVENHYPIGNILIWETDEEMPSLPEFAGVRLPDSAPTGGVAYLLDGHQRLATLYDGLRRRKRGEEEASSNARQRMYRDLRADETGPDRYHYREPDALPPCFLPMGSVLRTLDFLAFARRLTEHADLPVDELVEEAEEVAQRFKTYRLPLVRLRGGSPLQAFDVFHRINSAGSTLSPSELRDGRSTLSDPENPSQDRSGHEAQ
ncbi:DUF262 domain-containing protein [Nocardiopsis dassonvillei]|uniref:DUF262 domain-containing protein n=1 Tax=Nocardiopsis dassonvillei TaxID=2014 RepID=UPI002010B914|nr:DUF262 domain-containing protein [Nocardiopsis dassonvillei]MCK9871905.1 DUF262 domain-containing protein [Nocardiopsis dassonvillei]